MFIPCLSTSSLEFIGLSYNEQSKLGLGNTFFSCSRKMVVESPSLMLSARIPFVFELCAKEFIKVKEIFLSDYGLTLNPITSVKKKFS